MTDIAASRRSFQFTQSRSAGVGSVDAITLSLIILLALSFAGVVLGVFHRPIDGDEFHFLSNIYGVANAQPISLLQTPYVHLFGWLPKMGGDEIQQITVARFIFVGVWAGSLALLYLLGRRLIDPLGALAGVVLFALFSYSLANAASFRIDGLLLPVLLSIALLLLKPSVARTAAAGALSGVAVALTIKAVLWAPAFIGVLVVTLWDRHHRLWAILAGALAAIATLASIMVVHSWLISTVAAPMPGVSSKYMSTAGWFMFLEGDFFPKLQFFIRALVWNSATWILFFIGLTLALVDLRDPQSRRKALILVFVASPVLSIVFYANAFPYAYLVFMPGACLLAGRAFSRFMGAMNGLPGIAAVVCLVCAGVPLAMSAWEYRLDRQQNQKQVLSAVHDIFKEPVPHIDASGMVASFPRTVLPLSRFALASYRRAGTPVLSNYIRTARPPLLIVNTPVLDMWTPGMLEGLDPQWRLLPEDEEAIRVTYAHYWDQIYLAGRQWRDVAAGENRSFNIVIPGDYTLISSGPVIVDQQQHAPGATLTLAAGPHELQTTSTEADLRILWGRGLKLRPEGSPEPAD